MSCRIMKLVDYSHLKKLLLKGTKSNKGIFLYIVLTILKRLFGTKGQFPTQDFDSKSSYIVLTDVCKQTAWFVCKKC